MVFWLILLAVAVVLFALAWWSSGRTKRIVGRPDASAETDRGRALIQNRTHNDGIHGGPGIG